MFVRSFCQLHVIVIDVRREERRGRKEDRARDASEPMRSSTLIDATTALIDVSSRGESSSSSSSSSSSRSLLRLRPFIKSIDGSLSFIPNDLRRHDLIAK